PLYENHLKGSIHGYSDLSIRNMDRHAQCSPRKPLSSVAILRLAGPKEPGLELRHCGLRQCSALARLQWFRFGLAKIPAVGLASILNPELPASLGGLGAEDGLVQSESVGQGGEGHAL